MLQATEEDVHKLLGPHGTVWQLTVPRKPDGKLAGLQELGDSLCVAIAQLRSVLWAGTSKGFAFAAMTSRGDALKAIAAANGQVR